MERIIHDREEYQRACLKETDMAQHPIDQFEQWFDDAKKMNIYEPYAMTLSTVDHRQQPTARIVLLRGFSHEGFKFFTNYDSRKGHELAFEDKACLSFYWAELEQQIRIEGLVSKLSDEESDQYYHSRPLGNRLGAWASPQSQVITREDLLIRQQDFQQQYGDQPPRPAHWGGYILKPNYMEFWQGQPSRLHDRLVYCKTEQTWKLQRLAP